MKNMIVVQARILNYGLNHTQIIVNDGEKDDF